MKNEHFEFFERLGLTALASEKDVKRAYARLLKGIDRQSQASEFILLRQDYEAALFYISQNSNKDKSEEFDFSLSVSSKKVNTVDGNNFANLYDTDQQNYLLQQFSLELQQNINKCGEVNPYFLSSLVKSYLTKDEFISLEDRLLFEDFIAQELAERKFGVDNLRLLFIFTNLFAWDEVKLPGNSSLGKQIVWKMLDEVKNSSYEMFVFLYTVLDSPDASISKNILNQYSRIYKKNSSFIDFFVPQEHIQAWREINLHNYTYYRIKFFLIRSIELAKNAPLIFLKELLVLILKTSVILFLIYFFVSPFFGRHKTDPTLILNRCDQAYANAIENNWSEMSLRKANELWECSKTYAPQICESREKMVDLLSATIALYPKNSKEIDMVNLDYFYINTNARHYFFDENARCSDIGEFATRMRWDQSNDWNGLTQLIPAYEKCRDHVLKNESPGAFEIYSSIRGKEVSKLFATTDVSIKHPRKAKTNKSLVSVNQLLSNAQPYPRLNEQQIINENQIDETVKIFKIETWFANNKAGDKFSKWSTCIPLKEAKNLDAEADEKMGPLEKAIEKKRFALQQ